MARMARLSLLLVLGGLAGCGAGGPAYRRPAPEVARKVEMTWIHFEPDRIMVRVGDLVEFRNTTAIAHSVTFDPAAAADRNDARLPAGIASFASGDIPPGEVFRHRFEAPGLYRYFCTHHERLGMVGSVLVLPRE